MDKGFVHLHVHSHYSLLDGVTSPKDLAKKAAKFGMPALALTDHGSMYGLVDFYDACKATETVKPILGCEFYLVPEKSTKERPYHLTVLAKTGEGLRNMFRLLEASFTPEYFYGRGRIDLPLLRRHSKGLLALSGCLQGEVQQFLLAGKVTEAEEAVRRYQEIFEGDFYLEVQNHGIPEEARILPALLSLGGKLGVDCVATGDVHFLDPKDQELQDLAICIERKAALSDPGRFKISGENYHLMDRPEMEKLFAGHETLLDNTLKVAEKCNVELNMGEYHFTHYPDEKNVLRRKVYEGAKKRYGYPLPQEVIDRCRYEIEVIDKMGFSSYFLIVRDILDEARKIADEHDPPLPYAYGPGRGSAAGSIVAYCLEITDVCPLEHGLLFERFLNPDRVSMPDIDLDFPTEVRDKLIERLAEKYGADKVVRIGAFTVQKPRGAFRDAARALGMSASWANHYAKLIPADINDLSEINEDEEWYKEFKKNGEAMQVLDWTKRLLGNPRNFTQHAAGVVISDKVVKDLVPVRDVKGQTVTMLSKDPVEKMGLLKMDLLSLDTLDILNDTILMMPEVVEAASKRKLTAEEIRTIAGIPEKASDFTDGKTFDIVSEGKVPGGFQIDSPLFRRLLPIIRPQDFAELADMLALVRPGPLRARIKVNLDFSKPETKKVFPHDAERFSKDKNPVKEKEVNLIEYYAGVKFGALEVSYRHPVLEKVLGPTKGVMIYQEQAMQIARDMAGFTMAQADNLRKAIAKKKPELMAKMKEMFLQGAAKQGIDAPVAEAVFGDIEYFSGYGFNKSHSVAYAYLSYVTSWLLAHRPREFMCACLSRRLTKEERLRGLVLEAQRLGIPVYPPLLGIGQAKCVLHQDGIMLGFEGIKGLGEGQAGDLPHLYPTGVTPEGLWDLAFKSPLNSKALLALARSGALDGVLGEGKKGRFALIRLFEDPKGLAKLEKEYEREKKRFEKEKAKKAERDSFGQQMSFFANPQETSEPERSLVPHLSFTDDPELIRDVCLLGEIQSWGFPVTSVHLAPRVINPGGRVEQTVRDSVPFAERSAVGPFRMLGYVLDAMTWYDKDGNLDFMRLLVSDGTGGETVVVRFPKKESSRFKSRPSTSLNDITQAELLALPVSPAGLHRLLFASLDRFNMATVVRPARPELLGILTASPLGSKEGDEVEGEEGGDCYVEPQTA